MQFPKLRIIQQGLWVSRQTLNRTPLRFVLNYELEIHHEVGGKSVINGEEIDCFEGLITFSKPGDLRYSVRPDSKDYRRDFVRFEIECAPSDPWNEILLQIPSHLTMDGRASALWQDYQRFCGERKSEIKRFQAQMALCSLLIHLSEQRGIGLGIAKRPSAHQQALFQTICYMREHLGDNLSVGDIARHIGYSTSHFNHLFKSYTKVTPHAYYLTLKLSEARKLLSKTSLSISEIAERLSFGNTGKFSYAFKKECGMTPGQFRKLREQEIPPAEG